ncbi:Cro/Cl family transcriptional regulator [Salmonella phage 41]|nr:Cro/Cl family transcriptional regulator [Salmonella phage 41]
MNTDEIRQESNNNISVAITTKRLPKQRLNQKKLSMTPLP